MSILCCIRFETFKDLPGNNENTCTFVQGNCPDRLSVHPYPRHHFCSLPHNGNLLSYSRIEICPVQILFPSCPLLTSGSHPPGSSFADVCLQFSIEFENIIALFFPIEKIFFHAPSLPRPFRVTVHSWFLVGRFHARMRICAQKPTKRRHL